MHDKNGQMEFWRNKESDLNEKLVLRAVAAYEEGYPGYSDRTVGLLYLMSGSLNFEDFEKTAWGFTISRRGKYTKTEFRVPLEDIVAFQAVPPERLTLKNWWRFFSRGKPSRIIVDFLCHRQKRAVTFTNIVPFDEWEGKLQQAVARK